MSAIIPVERLTSHGQLFRCEPLHATMTVRACLARQGARTDGRVGPKKPAFPACAACSLGAAVAERVEGRRDTGAPLVRVCVEPGCSVVVTGGHPRMKPRCPDHRPHRSPASTTPTPPKETAMICENCKKHETSPVTARTPKGTETWCKHCRRVASMQAHGKGFFGRKLAPPADTAPVPEERPQVRLIVPPQTTGHVRVKVVTVECDASQVAAILGALL